MIFALAPRGRTHRLLLTSESLDNLNCKKGSFLFLALPNTGCQKTFLGIYFEDTMSFAWPPRGRTHRLLLTGESLDNLNC